MDTDSMGQEESYTLPEDAKEAAAHEITGIQAYLAATSDRLGTDIGPAVAH